MMNPSSERRTHWDDELIETTSAAIQRFMTLEVPNPQFVYEVIATVEDWHRAKRDSRIRTHSAECWRWHQECAEHYIDGLNATLERVRAKHPDCTPATCVTAAAMERP